MSATDILRRMLDERDEYYSTSGNKTWWGRPIDRQTGKPINVFHYQAQPMGEDRLLVELQLATPEQAIAATLGSCNCSDNCTNSERTETCHVESSIIDTYEYNRWEYELSCGHTIIWEDSEPPNYCPECGAKVVDPTTNDVDAEVDDG